MTTMNRLPFQLPGDGPAVTVDRMAPGHGPAVLRFAQRMPQHDLLFLRRDIAQPRVVDAWMAELAAGSVHSLVALSGDGEVVGCTALVRDELSWSRHVGELRVLVDPAMRGRGLGRVLVQQSFLQALDLGLEKLVAQMTVDQVGAVAVFEGLGFRAEALLKNHVKDRDGKPHDIALLSLEVAEEAARLHAFGLQ